LAIKLKSKSKNTEKINAPKIAFALIAFLLSPLIALMNSKMISPNKENSKKTAKKLFSENE
jgi:hypothetical protein